MQLEPVGYAHVAETLSHERVVPENRTILKEAAQLKLLLRTSGDAGSSCVAAATRKNEVQDEQS
jgi:hypothetical protein